MTGPHLVYFADPMCSWCWGFAPAVAAIRETFGAALPMRLVMGGLRPGTTEPMDAARKATIREHWQHVHDASGQPFDHGLFDRDGFVYDTDPAARAVVVVRRQDPDAAFAFLARVQRAFYAENRDVTRPAVLADLAAEAGHDAAAFAAALADEAVAGETVRDYAITQGAGVTGFPTLIVGGLAEAGRYELVTHGFQRTEIVLARLQAWLRQHAGAEAAV